MSQIRSSKAHNVEYDRVGFLEHVAHSALETKTFESARGSQMPVRGLTGESSKQANKQTSRGYSAFSYDWPAQGKQANLSG